jgi:hypothetical protein
MPPGQARMVDTWADYSGCWADVYDDDHEEMQVREANPDRGSALGLCADHETQIMASVRRSA